MKLKLLGAGVLVAMNLSLARADDPSQWAGYESNTLKQMVESSQTEKRQSDSLSQSDPNRRGASIFFYDKVKIDVVFLGSSRPVAAYRKAFLVDWAKGIKLDSNFPALFKTEFLFSEGKARYWLPVQEQLAPYLNKELRPGDAVTLFVGWAGATKNQNRWDDIFIVNEFKKD